MDTWDSERATDRHENGHANNFSFVNVQPPTIDKLINRDRIS